MEYYFNCPECGDDKGFTRPVERSSGLGCLLLFLGGIIPAWLYADAQSRRVQCDNCGYIFRQPALPKTGAAKLATAILLILILAGVSAVVLVCSSEVADMVPRPMLLRSFGLTVADNAEAFIVLVAATVVAIIFVCLLGSAFSRIAQRRRLSKDFALRPKRKTMPTDHQAYAGQSPGDAADGLTRNGQD